MFQRLFRLVHLVFQNYVSSFLKNTNPTQRNTFSDSFILIYLETKRYLRGICNLFICEPPDLEYGRSAGHHGTNFLNSPYKKRVLTEIPTLDLCWHLVHTKYVLNFSLPQKRKNLHHYIIWKNLGFCTNSVIISTCTN
jgi:hypothetical protein